MSGSRIGRWLVSGALALGLSLPAPVFAAPPRFGSASDTEAGGANAIWFDGHQRMVIVRDRVISIVRSEEQSTRQEPIAEGVSFVDVDGTRAIEGGFAVAVSPTGELMRWTGRAWEHGMAPLLEGDRLVSVVVDASGRAYVIGETKGVYKWEGDRWRMYPYPSAVRIFAADATAGGRVYLVGEGGLLLQLFDGEFDRVFVPGLPEDANAAAWHAAWFSPSTKTLWVRAGEDRLLEIDLETVRPSEHRLPLSAEAGTVLKTGKRLLDGFGTASGDRVVTTLGRAVYLYEKGRFFVVSSEPEEITSLALVDYEDAVYVSTRKGVRRRSLIVEEDDVEVPLDERQVRLLERKQRQEERNQRLRMASRTFWVPTLRTHPAAVLLPGRSPLAGFSLASGFGMMLAPIPAGERGPTLWIWPELTHRWEAHPVLEGHALDTGLGIGFGNHLVTGYYMPNLSFGDLGSGRANIGFRHGVSVQALWGTLGAEVAHQYVGTNAGPIHGIRFGLSLNIAPLIWIAILAATLPGSEQSRRSKRRARYSR